jgi:Fur family ferric uptake transcriptional regulator
VSSEKILGSSQKYRMTNQRKVILEEIRKDNIHPTADEVCEIVRKRLSRISLGTVYRNLEILSACGPIQKIGPQLSQMRYDGSTEKHYHLRYIYCGSVVDAPIDPIENLENVVREKSDFSILDHKLEFIGICSRCKKGRPAITNNRATFLYFMRFSFFNYRFLSIIFIRCLCKTIKNVSKVVILHILSPPYSFSILLRKSLALLLVGSFR